MRTFAFSDIHGELGLFKQIQGYMKEDDVCYVLGDCLDRGKHGISILKEIIKDKRFKMIKGNHEQMLIDQLQDIDDGYMDFHYYFQQGGLPTWEEWCFLTPEWQAEIFYFITHLPLRLDYKDKILTHAGFHVGTSVECEQTLLWDRSHIDYTTPMSGDKWIIHGHTPSPFIQEGYYGIIQYHEKKIGLDCGTPYSEVIGLLDLDTLETVYFGHAGLITHTGSLDMEKE